MRPKILLGGHAFAGLRWPPLASRTGVASMVDIPTAALLANALPTAAVIADASTVSLDALGSDIFTFLAASVLVVPLSRLLNVTPVLGFLALGCAIGPYGFGVFSNSEADLQLGDFGIVFLLFIEGLQLSPDRLKKLGGFFKLGLAQFLLTIATLTAANLYLGPQILETAERFIRLDDAIVRLILTTPVLAFTLAGAGALSSSAFVLPVLKQKGWEERADGTAALAVLLLQDIAVAPLLVILPLLAGSGPQSGPELGVLVFKGTFGFGAVLAAGSVVLREVFNVVAATRSSETFVAAALLVAIGMGVAAEELGLSTTTGAFAAGVLLAGSQYRQQIEADIKPFEGILLGIFFMTAGANLDPALCVQEWPTLLSGIVAFLAAKLGLIFGLGAFAFGLSRAEAIRIALLLAGGGEFAFVVFKLAEELGLLEPKLGNLLTASVIISMSLTPLLGEVAEYVGDAVEGIDASQAARAQADELFDAIDRDGNGTIEMDELRGYLLGGGAGNSTARRSNESFTKLFQMLDLNGDGVIDRQELRAGYKELILGEARDAALQYAKGGAATGVELPTAPDAVVVCGYGEMGQAACDVLANAEGVGGGAGADELRDQVALPSGAWGTQFIAFDRNPSRVSVGLSKQVRVVYGDGASPELLRAAGVSRPRAVVVTYANDKRCLEATSRLRDAFPDTPIYVRARTALEAEPLLQAGATEVVVEAVESVVRFATLLGTGPEAADALLRTPLAADSDESGDSPLSAAGSPPYGQEALETLASECGISLKQVCRLYDGFSMLQANDDGEVSLGSIRDMLTRVGAAPVEDGELEAWLYDIECDGSVLTLTSSLSFFDYVRLDSQRSKAISAGLVKERRGRPARSGTPRMVATDNATARDVGLLWEPLVRQLVAPVVRAFDRSGLDRGDFRWEFLVPWLKEGDELTRREEATVGATFVVAALAVQLAVDPQSSVTDNLSFIFFFLSYAVGNQLGFRLIAIVASSFEIFSHLVEKPQGTADLVPVTYNVLFLVINAYYALRWQLARQALDFAGPDEELYRQAFEPLGLRRSQFRQLMGCAETRLVGDEEGAQVVFAEGSPLTELFVSLDGNMDVVKGGVPVTTLEPYQLIGEVALLENLRDDSDNFAARATLVAEPGARYLSWKQADWYSLMKKDAEFAYATQLMISKTLSRKLGTAREEQGVMCDTVFSMMDQDGSGCVDAAELRSALGALGIEIDAADAVEMVRKYDADGSGSIGFQEFRALARDLPELQRGSPTRNSRNVEF